MGIRNFILASLFVAFQAGAAEYYVSTAGSDNNPGTLSSPFRTVNHAVSKLKAGDTLYIREGLYLERVSVGVSGTASAPVTIQSYPGESVVIDSGPAQFRVAGNSEWELVNASTGEYRSVKTYSSGYIFGYVAGIPGYRNERVALVPYKDAAQFRATTDQYVDASTPFYVGPGTFYDTTDNRIHIRLAKTSDMKAAEARYGTVFGSDLPDPRNYSILLSLNSYTMHIAGSYLVIKNLTVNQARRSIRLASGVHDVKFDGITAWTGHNALATYGSNVHSITLTRSRVYGDNPYWIFWSDMKNDPMPADRLRHVSIDMRDGAHDWDISYNHIRGSGQDLVSTNTNETRINVHHNRMESCGDDAFEIEGSSNVGEIRIFENFISNCLIAVAPGQDTPQFDGPLYFYRNTVSFLQNPPINRKERINTWNGGGRFGRNYMFKHSTASDFSTRNTHYYHNTLIMLNHSGKGLNIIPKYAEDTRIANNIMIMVNGPVMGSYRSGSGQVMDGNLYWKMNSVESTALTWSYKTVAELFSATGFEAHGVGDVPKQGSDPLFAHLPITVVNRSASVWALTAGSEFLNPSDYLLSSSSPGIGRGILIPSHPAHGAMPDSRNSQDIGAWPYGTLKSEFDIFPFNVAGETGSDDGSADPEPEPEPEPNPDSPSNPSALAVRVSSGSDDAEERSNGRIALNSSDLELVSDGRTQQIVGIRLQNIHVPAGATITKAYVQFVANETSSVTTTLRFFAHKTAKASPFTTAKYDISRRSLTSSSAQWDVPAWGRAGDAHNSPDLKALIQEVVSLPDWVSGNPLALIITGSGTRVAEAFEGSSSSAPLLVIEYSAP